jgi:hypothetical protein
MEAETRKRAETRLADAAAEAGLVDPRPPFRERLRQLRETEPAAFERAIAHYEREVLPALAQGDALRSWCEYGRFLGGLTAEGELTVIDESGRAAEWSDAEPDSALVLFIPRDTSVPVLVAAQPSALSPAQSATLDLLVNRKLSLS